MLLPPRHPPPQCFSFQLNSDTGSETGWNESPQGRWFGKKKGGGIRGGGGSVPIPIHLFCCKNQNNKIRLRSLFLEDVGLCTLNVSGSTWVLSKICTWRPKHKLGVFSSTLSVLDTFQYTQCVYWIHCAIYTKGGTEVYSHTVELCWKGQGDSNGIPIMVLGCKN